MVPTIGFGLAVDLRGPFILAIDFDLHPLLLRRERSRPLLKCGRESGCRRLCLCARFGEHRGHLRRTEFRDRVRRRPRIVHYAVKPDGVLASDNFDLVRADFDLICGHC